MVRQAVFFGFAPWKNFIPRWFPGVDCKVVTRNPKLMLLKGWPWRLLLRSRPTAVLVWGFKYPRFLRGFCRLFGFPFYYVEDGFVRSISLGSTRAAPASLIIDGGTLHYDARNPSDLEQTLQNYNFGADAALMERADRCIQMLLDLRVSKYNLGTQMDLETLIGPKTKRRVLVVGQVETDAAIAHGCDKPFNNNDLVRLAVSENPDAQVIYKPHPDTVHRKRAGASNPADVAHICELLETDVTPADALDTVDHVYTITSLMGFEALLRGIPVTCVGLPFYAGWGATDDRQTSIRRKRRLSPREIFAAAYLMHSLYYDPETGEPADLETVICRLIEMRDPRP
ncbi:capsular polysaccharide biosynthesis protein [Sinorhizobium meliloti]|uniref:capsular polysaccharide export protein, LipB/KpsS family n=1 Tax=Rhizobium meliloti TaxID=382 RepID=UPI0023809298|nr:capsular polysaccharide biosynthesis protein [Sinorhizobium meliloti]MDE3816062.1 capsular polysaccharide biosynthesis protein [Sinorhizobium meliloti]MDW9502145.1 capsular polysaccharide biosynthesis protein [Sinorhizobium meliloti]MDW9614736.1 capsular polysaccharide biosynthesis protein [Sinorhizobium meliloti]MDW9769694.1 capsular polysaccharide biosynthesis protein [Sinorhizobium meliloti]MDW9837463.1 capsular polysaccharide biosynthesis protein [Sinorhizobium meliloti]